MKKKLKDLYDKNKDKKIGKISSDDIQNIKLILSSAKKEIDFASNKLTLKQALGLGDEEWAIDQYLETLGLNDSHESLPMSEIQNTKGNLPAFSSLFFAPESESELEKAILAMDDIVLDARLGLVGDTSHQQSLYDKNI